MLFFELLIACICLTSRTVRQVQAVKDYAGHALVKIYIDQLKNQSLPVRHHPEDHISSDASSIALPPNLHLMWEGEDETSGRRFVVGHVPPNHHHRFKRDANFEWISSDLRDWIRRTQSRLNNFRMSNNWRSSRFQTSSSSPSSSFHLMPESVDFKSKDGYESIGETDDDLGDSFDPLVQTNRSNRSFNRPTYSQFVSGFQMNVYHPLDEIYGYLQQLSLKLPHVKLFTIGYTYEQRPIVAVEIVQDPFHVGKKLVYLDALTHAREWITGGSILRLIELIILRNVKCNFLIVPVVNPDGYSYTWTHDRLWRKNRRPSSTRMRALSDRCIGIDLNRNFDFNFGGEGSSTSRCSQLYAGNRPFSEAETSAIAKVIAERSREIKLIITLHSFSQLWSSPWAYTKAFNPHLEEYAQVLSDVQQAVYAVEGVRYKVGPLGQSLYVGAGFLMDWAYSKLGIVHSYLVELRDKGEFGFLLPQSQILGVAEEVFAGLNATLRHVY